MKMPSTRLLLDPLIDTNPITVQVLGICSALAVTRFVEPALAMALAVTFVLLISNLSISLLRGALPDSVRLILQITIIASAVIVIDQFLQAFFPQIAVTLSVFVGLIITNCIVLGRAESFARHQPPLASAFDAIGNGAGYGVILLSVAVIRELWGEGSLLGHTLISTPESGVSLLRNAFMAQPASTFFIVGLLIWALRAWRPVRIEGGASRG